MSRFGGAPKCVICKKSAYPEESIKYDMQVFHNACFRCLNCKSSVSIRNVAMLKGELYCKNCFVRIFKTKGSYATFAHQKEANAGSSPISPPISPVPGGPAPHSEPNSVSNTPEKQAEEKVTGVPKAQEEKPQGQSAVKAALAKDRQQQQGSSADSSPARPIPRKLGLVLPGASCAICSKSVPQDESKNYDGKTFHNECFRCITCKTGLDLKSVSQSKGDLYCKNCFPKIFKRSQSEPNYGAEPEKKENKIVAHGGPMSAKAKAAAYQQKLEAVSAPVPGKSSGGASGVKPKFGGGEKCSQCGSVAYPQESQTYDNRLYHKTCFKCRNCKGSLPLSNVAMYQGDLYCKVCFTRMFKTKGSYNIFNASNSPANLISPTSPISPFEGRDFEKEREDMQAKAEKERQEELERKIAEERERERVKEQAERERVEKEEREKEEQELKEREERARQEQEREEEERKEREREEREREERELQEKEREDILRKQDERIEQNEAGLQPEAVEQAYAESAVDVEPKLISDSQKLALDDPDIEIL